MKISNTDLNIEWTTSQKNGGSVLRVRDMTDTHRASAVKQLHTFAKDRKEGYDSFWYKTGKTIGQMIVILTSGISNGSVGKTVAVAQKRKEEKEFVMVPVKRHLRKVMIRKS